MGVQTAMAAAVVVVHRCRFVHNEVVDVAAVEMAAAAAVLDITKAAEMALDCSAN